MKQTIAAIRDAIDKECWLPALALALTIPDVLGQIAYPELVNNRGKRLVSQQYERWFHENVEHRFADHTGFEEDEQSGERPDEQFNVKAKRPYFTADMCYRLRCELLHAGNDDITFEYGDREEGRDYEYDFELFVHATNSYGSWWSTPTSGERVVERVHVGIDIKMLCDALCDEAERFLQDVDEKELERHSVRIVDIKEYSKFRERNNHVLTAALAPVIPSDVTERAHNVLSVRIPAVDIPLPTTLSLPDMSALLKPLLESYWKAFEPALETARKLVEDIDWDRLKESAQVWGEYGWLIADYMTYPELLNTPSSLQEADAIGITVMDEDATSRLFEKLATDPSSGVIVQEAIEQFEGGRYRAAAMLVCSQIDGRLISRQPIENNRVTGIRAFQRLERSLESILPTFLNMSAVEQVIKKYFDTGSNFDPTKEGEFNRNYLMHGMSNAEVTRTVCVKLFLLLDAIIDLTDNGAS